MQEGNLHKWFKGSKSKDGKSGWVNVVTGGTCASDKPGEGTPKCVSSSKRASMTPEERKSAQSRKKKADPNQQSKSGAAKPTYVSTDKPKSKMKEEMEINEEDKKGSGSGKKDACYKKVKASASVWPSAYASGRLVQCRKKGAANYGKSKNEEFMALPEFTDLQIRCMEASGIEVEVLDEKCWVGYTQKGMKKKGKKVVPNCVKVEGYGVGYVTPNKERESYTDEKGTVRHKSGAKMEEVERLDEISLKTKMSAFKKRATHDFESDGDSDNYTKSGKNKTDKIKANIVKKHGKKAGEHAERAAHAGIFGRKSFSMPKKPTNEEFVDEAITSEKGKAKMKSMIDARTTDSGRAKSGKAQNVKDIKHIGRANVDGYGGTPSNLKVAKNPVKSNFTGLNSGTGNKAKRRADALTKNEEFVDEAMSSYDKNRKRAAQRAADRNAARAAGKTGVVPGVGYVTPIPKKDQDDAKARILAKTKAKREKMKEEKTIEEATRVPAQNGNIYLVGFTWRGKYIMMKLFFPDVKRPSRKEVQSVLEKIYPGCYLQRFDLTPYKPGEPMLNVGVNEESSKSCSRGEYYCNESKKCKPVPKGHHVMSNGDLMKDEDHNEGGDMSEGAAWQRKEGKNKEGGLNEKGRKSYERENPGSDLKAPQPEGGPRKKSFCARMGGVKGPMKKPNGEPTRKALALRKWKC